MKIIVETTPEQDDALTKSNEDSNRGGVVPPMEEFALSILQNTIDVEVKRWAIEKKKEVLDKLSNFDKLSAEDRATIEAIAAKLVQP